MDQQTINDAEWTDASNWTGPKWLSVYFSKRDSRAWVPKQIHALGWTVNLGQPAGFRWFLGIVASIMAVMLGTAVWIASVS